MNLTEILLSIPLTIFILILMILWYRLLTTSKSAEFYLKEQPIVSVMIAFRNEEAGLENCILSLIQLNYPQNKLQILLGDDNSSDKSTQIAQKYAALHSNIEYYHIKENTGKAKGKANVLAQLAHHANADAEFLFITDADIIVPPEWINTLLQNFEKDTAMVCGITIVNPIGISDTMQSLEWVYYMAILKAAASNDKALIGIGNNMAVRKKAYWETGGYENIEFSVTEDYKLFKCLKEIGWNCKFIFKKNALAYSKPVWPVYKLLQQRKRWLTGGKELSVFTWIIMVIKGMFVPCVLLLLFVNLHLALLYIIVKFLLQTLFILTALKKIEQKVSFIALLVFYEPYFYMMSVIMPFYFLKPGPVVWKGRKYP